jgi:hypothetical protein
VTEKVDVHAVAVEQADDGGVDVGRPAGHDVADVGDGYVHGPPVFSFDDERLILALDAARGGEPIGTGCLSHQPVQQ